MLKTYIYVQVDIAASSTPPYTSAKEEFQYLVNTHKVSGAAGISRVSQLPTASLSGLQISLFVIITMQFPLVNYVTVEKLVTWLNFIILSTLHSSCSQTLL